MFILYDSIQGRANMSYRQIQKRFLRLLLAAIFIIAFAFAVLCLKGCDDPHEARMSCAAGNLVIAMRALLDYAEEHDGVLPADEIWRRVVDDWSGMKNVAQCPVDGSPYRYFGSKINLKEYGDPIDLRNRILLLCQREHCRGKLHVGFANGRWDYCYKEDVYKAIYERASGQLPLMNPPKEKLSE